MNLDITDLPLYDELLEVLLDLHPHRGAAEEAAGEILDGRGERLLPDVIWNLSNHTCDREEAAQCWTGILQHRDHLSAVLDRDPGLRVATLDYFNVLGRKVRPRVVHPEILERLYAEATSDLLTGLANRRRFQDRLADEISRAGRYGTTFSIALFDVDGFKAVNDLNGHAEGDRVLIQIGHGVRSCIRASDFGARWGGEEFAVLMPETLKEGAAVLAERLRAWVESNLAREQITLSGGLATFPVDGDGEDALFRFADRCLYAAKARGKNCIETEPKERRSYARIHKEVPLRLTAHGSDVHDIEGRTSDISQGGFGFEHRARLEIADQVEGQLVLSPHIVTFRGRVAHVEETEPGVYHIGVSFTDVAAGDQRRIATLSKEPKGSA